MRKPVLLIFTNALLLIAIFGLLAQSLFIVQRVAQVKSIRGRVEIQRSGDGNFVPLASGAPVKMGDVVRTGVGSSAEFSWLDGTRWKLLDNSQLTIEKASYSSSKKTEVSRLDLDKGKVLVRLTKALPASSTFEVKTPTALAVTHGQTFSVQVENGMTSVDVFRGSVDIAGNPDGAGTTVVPGQRAVETALGWKLDRDMQLVAFQSESDFIKPHLEVTVKKQDDGCVLLSGQVEANSKVLIDGDKVPVLGNGVFFKRLSVRPGFYSWKIESTDSFGEKSLLVKNFEVEPASLETNSK